jgi:hypothetical protein
MAGNFTSPNSGTKMKLGKANRPKRTSPTGHGMSPKAEYPITDSFASKTIPGFTARKASSHTKGGFNCTPARHSGKGF